jgi:uncharacterized membrane protein
MLSPMNKEDNVVFVLQRAVKLLKIKVTAKSIKEFLLAHPYYPSMKSVCDALTKWKIENYPLNLEPEEIKALEMPFIAHLKAGGGQLAFVEGINNELVTYFLSNNKKQEESYKKFSEKLSGAVVVFEAGKESGEKDYLHLRQNEILNNYLLPFVIASLVILGAFIFSLNSGSLFIQSGYLFWGLLLTKVLGLSASVFLVLHELKVHTPIAYKICGFSSKTDCDAILSSNASRLFGWINWADAGLVYFTATLLYLAGANGIVSFCPLAVISLLALPYPIFSIYYQAVKTKKWCPFCLMVQVVLLAEFMLLFPVLGQLNISINNILQLAASFLIPAAFWFLYKTYRNTLQEQNNLRYSFLGFKRNPDIFRFLLTKNSQEEIPVTPNSLVLGNPDAPVTLTAFLSLYCNPCAGAFKQLKVLLESPDVKTNIIFSIYDDEESKKLINTLYFIYLNKSSDHAVDFLYKWYSTDKQNRKSFYKYENFSKEFDVTVKIATENNKLFADLNISGTPTIFLNGFKYPVQYDYKDIEYYVDELKKLKNESNSQKACAACH